MNTQNHSGSGDNIGRDKNTNVRIKVNPVFAFLLLLVLLISAFFTYKYVEDNKPKIEELNLTGNNLENGKEISTLDDIIINWTYSGKNDILQIKLIQLETGKETDYFERMLYDKSLVIPQNKIARLFEDALLHQSFSIRVTIQLRDRNYQFGPFNIMTGLNILYYLDETNNTLEIFSKTGKNIVPHSADILAVCYAKNTLDVQRLELKLTRGKAKDRFPDGFSPDLSNLKIVYFGDYPFEFVRYSRLNQ